MTSEESHEFTHPACPDFDQSHTGQFGLCICKYGYTDVEVLSDTIWSITDIIADSVNLYCMFFVVDLNSYSKFETRILSIKRKI